MKNKILLTSLFISMLIVGCGTTAEDLVMTKVAETDAVSTQEADLLTQTANANTPTFTPSPTPTNTETPTATPDLAATEAVKSTQEAEAIIAEIDEVLQEYGYSTDSGHLGWVQEEEFKFRIRGYWEEKYFSIGNDEEIKNFIIHYDVSLTSEDAYASCGLVFRSKNDLIDGKQYQFTPARWYGLKAWDIQVWEDGFFLSSAIGDWKFNNAIKMDGRYDNFVLIADGKTGAVYGNGTRLSNISLSSLSNGYIGYYAFHESGELDCSYKNGWIWVLDDE